MELPRQSTAFFRAILLCSVLLLTAAGCEDETSARPAGELESATETLSKAQLARDIGLTWVRDLTLQESEDVLNVEIAVRRTKSGDYLVADAEEVQVRRYDSDGSLIYAFGSEGEGPLEFSSPTAALDIPGDSLMVVDFQANVSIVRPPGDSLISTMHLPLGPIYDADVIDGERVLLSGRSMEGPERLHVLNYRSGEIVESFFPPPTGDERSVNAVGMTNSDVWGDTIATVFALTDTIYYFNVRGTKLRQQEFRSEHFREWRTPPPTESRAERLDWYRSFSYTTEIFRPTEDLTIVQYQDRARNMTPRWRLVGLRPDGSTVFDLVDTPRLLAARPTNDELVFVTPRSLTPNHWSVASLE